MSLAFHTMSGSRIPDPMDAVEPEKLKKSRVRQPVTEVQFKRLAHQLGYNTGSGVYDAVMEYIREHVQSFDTSRNVQWDECDLAVCKAWFDAELCDKKPVDRKKVQQYVKDLVVSCLVHASRIAQSHGRKTIKRKDMELTLKFLADVY